MAEYIKARKNEILDQDGRQLAIVLGSNVTKSVAAKWAQFIVDRENSQRRGTEIAKDSKRTKPAQP